MSKFFDDTMQGLMEAIEIDGSEIPKHKKKKQSSTSKSHTKSKHKHNYKECLFIEKGHPHRGEYCTICGKIGDIHLFESERTEDGMRRMLNYNEIYERYEHLEQIEVEDIFQKFVPVRREENEYRS